MIYFSIVVADVLLIIILSMFVCIKNRFDMNYFFKIGIWGGMAAVLGSRILASIEQIFLLDAKSNFFDLVLKGGSSALGGIVLGLLAICYGISFYGCNNGEAYRDTYMLLICIFHAIWKIGCAFAGCCYGIRCEGIISITYANSQHAPNNVGLFPIQIVEAIVIFGIAVFLYFRKMNKKEIMAAYFIIYGFARYIIEFFRFQTEEQRKFSQLIAICFICFGIIREIYIKRTRGKVG